MIEPPLPRMRRSSQLLLIALLLCGLGLRIGACSWNKEVMHGDVGLFAVSARELARTGSLEYPYRSNLLVEVPDGALREPASWHRPLFSTVTGLLSRATGLDAYTVLRGLSLTGGLALLAAMALCAARASKRRAPFICMIGVCFSPLLIDFSGNGSPYVLLALWLWSASLWLAVDPPRRAGGLVAFGLLAGIATELHANQVGLPLVFLIVACCVRPRLGAKGTVLFLSSFLLALSPGLIWSWANGLGAFSAGAGAAFMNRWGQLGARVSGDGYLEFVRAPLLDFPLLSYLKQTLVQVIGFARDFGWELGPFAVLLLVFGARCCLDRRGRWLAALPVAGYLVVIALWANHDHRFLVPVVPLAWWLISLGFDRLVSSRHQLVQVVAGLSLVGALLWPGVRLLRTPRSQYYGTREAEYQMEYANLRALGTRLASEPPGIVLGWGRGEETVWWSEQPYVNAIWADRVVFEVLLRDFQPLYVLTRGDRIGEVQSVRPGATLLQQRGEFVVLALPGN
jgi:hypothetical protein